MNLYEPQPSDPRVPSVVIEDETGRFLVRGTCPDPTRAFEQRVPYNGAVRRDPIPTTLRGIAWSLGVPDAMSADVPQ